MEKLFFFLIFQVAFTLVLVYCNKKYWNFKLKNYQIAIISSLIFYMSIVIIMVIQNHTCNTELEAFDINKDGLFSVEERTDKQQIAMKRVISDTGRNLAPFIGILYSFIYFILIIIPLKIFNKKLDFNS